MSYPLFLHQQQFILLAVLSSNYWFFDFGARVFIIFKIFGFFLVILVPFEIVLHYPNIDSSHWLSEDVQWIVEKFSEKKAYGLNSFDTFFSQFSTELLDFACFCCCFHSQ